MDSVNQKFLQDISEFMKKNSKEKNVLHMVSIY